MSDTDKTILIVDDEAELLEMVRAIFTRAGYGRVLTAGSGAEALAVCTAGQPDIVILDVMMPGMDGFEVLRQLRQSSSVPVLMLTARGEAEDKFTGFECGADDYLAKPFLPRELLFRVQAILRRTSPAAGRMVRLAAAEVDLENAAAHRDGQVSPSPPRSCSCSANCTRTPAASSPPAPSARRSAGRSGRGTKAPWPPTSATCGKRSRPTPPGRCPS